MSERVNTNKKLVGEERWFRVYEIGPYPLVYESKFATGELSVSEGELRKEWESWNDTERLKFAHAYNSKVHICPEDEKVLEFLMAQGDERVWASIALCLTRHSNKKLVLNFLLDRLKTGSESKANFFQALRNIRDPEAIPSLRDYYNQSLRTVRVQGESTDPELLIDFISCCATLRKLDTDPTYEKSIKSFLNHPNETVRNFAKLSLSLGDWPSA